ncbi:uncharacterized protein F21D5.5 isoform X1 [Octopus bimaculoides]|nr:uncharacterized protein F21D5.5 isoform X1 [Octopus bimaculoides]|eukprot:XP_014773495.1 PREDICTED: uncharacterized protein F21D5.5-like isoform X1 [Octopus bimaculoides]
MRTGFYTMKFDSCELVCLKGTHRPIPLPHRETVIIGRTKQTLISDARCSREQLEICADWESGEVLIKQIGSNNSAVDDKELNKGEITRLPNNATLYILTGEYPHIVKIKHHYTNKVTAGCSGKRQHSDTDNEKSSVPAKKPKHHKEIHSSKDKESIPTKVKSTKSKDLENKHRSDKVKRKIQVNEVSSVQNKPEKNKHESESLPANSESSDKTKTVPPCPASKWSQFSQLMIFTKRGTYSRNKIAGFDLDGTIIRTQSGKVFPQHSGDWKIIFPQVISKLKELFQNGYKVVLFTNQHGVKTGNVKMEEMKTKIENIVNKLEIPIQVFVATGTGVFRKPVNGMWVYLQDKENDNITIDHMKSFYVGDAAGRPDNWKHGKKKDFSCSDRLFAININVKFYTPEEYFLSAEVAPFNMPDFDPRRLLASTPLTNPPKPLTLKKQELILLVGYPAGGKTTFVKTHLEPAHYVHINRDILGNWKKCVALCRQNLENGKSVVVDNTNPDKESRKRYIDVAKQLSIPCRCFHFAVSLNHARHNEKYRVMISKSKPVADMVMHAYRKHLEVPTISEGFLEILSINFVPKFSSPMHEKLYTSFLLDRYFEDKN